jgi:hypothetical protein
VHRQFIPAGDVEATALVQPDELLPHLVRVRVRVGDRVGVRVT